MKFALKDKVALRKWFYTLDADGSGEVNADELHDPMLSTGILKTKNQVFTTLLTMNNSKSVSSGGVNFETFQKAIHKGEFADRSKIKILQNFCENRHEFSVDTLFSQERRKLLFKAIVEGNQKRTSEVENVWNKSNTSYDSKLAELRNLEEYHINHAIEQDSYIEELHEALKLNKRLRENKLKVKQQTLNNLRSSIKLEEKSINKLKLDPLYPGLYGSVSAAVLAQTSHFKKGNTKLNGSKSVPRLNNSDFHSQSSFTMTCVNNAAASKPGVTSDFSSRSRPLSPIRGDKFA